MKGYSRLTKKELIEELRVLDKAYDTCHNENMCYFSYLDSLAKGLYYCADQEVDSLPLNFHQKESLHMICKILKAVTPQGGI